MSTAAREKARVALDASAGVAAARAELNRLQDVRRDLEQQHADTEEALHRLDRALALAEGHGAHGEADRLIGEQKQATLQLQRIQRALAANAKAVDEAEQVLAQETREALDAEHARAVAELFDAIDALAAEEQARLDALQARREALIEQAQYVSRVEGDREVAHGRKRLVYPRWLDRYRKQRGKGYDLIVVMRDIATGEKPWHALSGEPSPQQPQDELAKRFRLA